MNEMRRDIVQTIPTTLSQLETLGVVLKPAQENEHFMNPTIDPAMTHCLNRSSQRRGMVNSTQLFLLEKAQGHKIGLAYLLEIRIMILIGKIRGKRTHILLYLGNVKGPKRELHITLGLPLCSPYRQCKMSSSPRLEEQSVMAIE